MADLITAAKTQIKYASNEFASGDAAKGQTHLDKADGFLARASVAVAALVDLEPDGNDPRFIVIDNPDEVYLVGGTEAGNPNGVSFTLGQARDWWIAVFDGGLNIGKVRSTLTPGSHVLSAVGIAAARELGSTSTVYADADYNPLDLEVIA